MGGYLQTYGAGEEKRERVIKGLLITVTAVVLGGGALAIGFRNFGEKRAASGFLEELQTQNYKAAYARFGCTDAHPCPNYTYTKFMEDFGPNSAHKSFSGTHTELIRTCQSSVVEAITFPNGEQIPLMVEKGNRAIGFAPYPYSQLTQKKERSGFEQFKFWLGDLLHPCQ